MHNLDILKLSYYDKINVTVIHEFSDDTKNDEYLFPSNFCSKSILSPISYMERLKQKNHHPDIFLSHGRGGCSNFRSTDEELRNED